MVKSYSGIMAGSNEISKPKWLNTAFFESALRSAEGENITVISSEVKAATAPGDNYGSDMYRAAVKFKRGTETEEISIIVKASKDLAHGIIAKIMDAMNIFDQETAAFAIVFPAMYNLLNEVPSLSNQSFAAKYFYSHSDETASSIVLEDLKVKDFRLADNRMSGLDLKHCLLVMKTIARFHAASLVLYQKDPAMFKPFMDNVFSIDKDIGIGESFAGNVNRVAKEVEKWPDYREKFLQKLHNIRDTVMEQWRKAIIRNDEEFNVLCHGDLWLNNMMFRYSDDTGEVEEVRFVDFQLTYWTSPAVDLQYFIHTSASAEALEHFELMIQEYYNTLCEILALLKHPHLQPTMTVINRELETRGRYAMLSTIVGRNVVLVDRSKIPDLENMTKENDTIQLSEVYKESLKKLLPLFEVKGWI
ncbi:uncharacterized protein [Periplaneta americana]|uniref:uncharacterized protein n=1 Tax=Periplaneta americana TaxID=6978 RepID=UPI0037E76949